MCKKHLGPDGDPAVGLAMFERIRQKIKDGTIHWVTIMKDVKDAGPLRSFAAEFPVPGRIVMADVNDDIKNTVFAGSSWGWISVDDEFKYWEIDSPHMMWNLSIVGE